jgi:hypothetical protein
VEPTTTIGKENNSSTFAASPCLKQKTRRQSDHCTRSSKVTLPSFFARHQNHQFLPAIPRTELIWGCGGLPPLSLLRKTNRARLRRGLPRQLLLTNVYCVVLPG